MRGLFTRGDGLILPNNVTLDGAVMILGAALRDESPGIYLGLISGNPLPQMTLADVIEPTVGVHGYARQQLTRDNTGWISIGWVGSEAAINSRLVTFAASGGNFDKAIQRVALFGQSGQASDNVIYAISAPLAAPETITPTTNLANRQFQYSLFL